MKRNMLTFVGLIGLIITPVTALNTIPDSPSSEPNPMVEKTKQVTKNTLGFLGMSILWGVGAGLVGFATGYGLTKGINAAKTGRLDVANEPGTTDGSMTTSAAGQRGGAQRQRAI